MARTRNSAPKEDMFTRTLITTEITIQKSDGTQGVVVVNGDVGFIKAKKVAEKNHPEYGEVTILGLKPVRTTYELSVSDFMKYAKPVEPKEKKDGETA